MNKYLILTFLFAFAFGIESIGQKDDLKKRTLLFDWPKEFEPEKSKFFVHNEIDINADPEVVWGILIDAMKWESWYEGAKNVSFLNQTQTTLEADTQFNWETMGLKFPNTTIRQFEPYKLLAWESRIKSIQGYHIWLIIPTESGCKVITEEAQNGWLTFFEKTFQGKKLHRLHDVWLREMKMKAESL